MDYELLSKLYYKDSDNYESRYNQRFNSESSIKLPITIHSNPCFYMVTLEMLNQTANIYKKNRNVHDIILKMPNIAINFFINKSLKEEIMLTNEIEGVSSTRKEVNEAMHCQLNDKKTRFKGLVAKYIKLIQEDEIHLNTCEDIRKIYDDIVLDELDEQDKPDGRIFRKEIVHVMSSTQKEKHRGVMPEENIIETMNLCLNYLKANNANMLIKVAVFHYLFGYVHPFYDGNGRTSRFISSCLLKNELGILPSLRLSYVIKNNLKDYYQAFDICNDAKNKGDVTHFILMFLNLIEEASDDLFHKLNDLNEKLSFYKNSIMKYNFKKKKEQLLYVLCQNALFEDSFIMIDELHKVIGLSRTSIREIIKELDDVNLLLKERIGRNVGYSANLNTIDKLNG